MCGVGITKVPSLAPVVHQERQSHCAGEEEHTCVTHILSCFQRTINRYGQD